METTQGPLQKGGVQLMTRRQMQAKIAKDAWCDSYLFYQKYHGKPVEPGMWEEATRDFADIMRKNENSTICARLMLAAFSLLEEECR